MKIVWIVFLNLVSFVSYADIYQSSDRNGSLVFSDTPSPLSKQYNVHPENEIHFTKEPLAEKKIITTPEKNSEEKKEETKPVISSYATFSISYPKNQENFHNQRQINVAVLLDPALDQTHSIQLYVDQVPVLKQKENLFLLENLTRGEHTVSAAILKESGEVVQKSPSVTFFIHYGQAKS